ncbi:MAG: hypothetical protein AAF602_11630 [Myxococcota bacterium]
MSQRDEEAAETLARFLESDGKVGAEALDEDVREALFAIKPDLAPAPRLTADDILATVQRGPLVDTSLTSTPESLRSREGAEVVAFPGGDDEAPAAGATSTAPDAPPEVSPPRRWSVVGGASGVGLLIAAAATLLLVSRPVLQEAVQSEAPGRPAVSASDRAAEAAAPADEADDEVLPREEANAYRERVAKSEPVALPERLPQDLAPTAERRRAPPSEVPAEPAVTDDLAGDVGVRAVPSAGVAARRPAVRLDASEVAGVREGADEDLDPSAIPEVLDMAQPGPVATEVSDRLRGLARPSDLEPRAWRTDLTPARLAVLDETLAAAQAARDNRDPELAAELLGPLATRPPTRAAQHFAALAATDFLAAQQAARAEAIARQGLSQSRSNTPERSQLLYLLGLALEARGASAQAAAAYEEARIANEAR